MKITKATVIKLVVATIVPGGFILWGLHELGRRYRQNSEKPSPNPPQTGSGKSDGEA